MECDSEDEHQYPKSHPYFALLPVPAVALQLWFLKFGLQLESLADSKKATCLVCFGSNYAFPLSEEGGGKGTVTPPAEFLISQVLILSLQSLQLASGLSLLSFFPLSIVLGVYLGPLPLMATNRCFWQWLLDEIVQKVVFRQVRELMEVVLSEAGSVLQPIIGAFFSRSVLISHQ